MVNRAMVGENLICIVEKKAHLESKTNHQEKGVGFKSCTKSNEKKLNESVDY